MHRTQLAQGVRAALAVVLVGLVGEVRAQALPPSEPSARVLDRVVAVVRIRTGTVRTARPQDKLPPDVITQTGLEFEARVAMVQRGALRAATEPLDEATLQSALELAISERLLAGEADVLQAWRVEASEVEGALRAFRDRFPSESEFNAFLKKNERDVQGLGRVLERSLRAAKVLDSKVRLRAQVSESEVRRYYDANEATLRQPYEDVRSAIREKLFRDRYQRLVRAELEQLERTHDVRRVAPFAQARRGRAEG